MRSHVVVYLLERNSKHGITKILCTNTNSYFIFGCEIAHNYSPTADRLLSSSLQTTRSVVSRLFEHPKSRSSSRRTVFALNFI